MAKIKPAFKKNNLAIVLSSDRNYVPYLAVTIKSIFDHADPLYNYDVLVFDDGITEYQKQLLSQESKPNCSIRYIDVKSLLENVDASLFQAKGIWSVATFYRLFIPQIMIDYEKVLYLDCDILVKDSLVDLFKIDLKNNQVACVCDSIKFIVQKDRISDCEQKLRLKDYRKYFNAGVVLFNIAKIDYQKFKNRFFEILKTYQLPFLDQDVLNVIFENKCLFLDFGWNYQYHILNDYPQLREIKELDIADKNPKIIHYTTPAKPWNCPALPHAADWWLVARTLPFYEEIIFKNTKISNLLLRNLVMHKRLRFRYELYKLFRTCSWGKYKRNLSITCNKLQNQVRSIRDIFRVK